MPDFVKKILEVILEYRSIAGGFLGPALPWLEFGAAVISLALAAGIIYTAVKSNWLIYRVDEFVDVFSAGDIGRRRTLRAWRRVLKNLDSGDPKKWNSAILEADKMLGEILRLSGFEGGNIHERLERVQSGVLRNVEELREAHRIRDRIFREPGFTLKQEDAAKLIHAYRKAFRDLALID